MSSQTTDTPGTTTTKQPWIAPEQLFKLTRIHEALQTSVSAISNSTKGPPPGHQRAKSAPFSRPFRRGSVAIFPLQRRRLELLYTPTRPGTNRASGRENPGKAGAQRPFQGKTGAQPAKVGSVRSVTAGQRTRFPFPDAAPSRTTARGPGSGSGLEARAWG